VAITSDEVDIFVLADEARERGFFLQPQLSYAGLAASLHVTLTGVSEAGIEDLLSVLAESVAAAAEAGPAQVPAELLSLLGTIDFDGVDDAGFAALLPAVGVNLTATGIGRMAVINTVLDVLPPATRELILTRFLSALYSPHLA
jgi:hypothetical protein